MRSSNRRGTLFMDDLDADTTDELLDLGLTEDQVDAVWAWHLPRCRALAQTAGGVALVRMLTHLFSGNRGSSIAIRAAGMLFAFRLEHLAGWSSMEQAGEELGCSQPALSRTAREARLALEAR